MVPASVRFALLLPLVVAACTPSQSTAHADPPRRPSAGETAGAEPPSPDQREPVLATLVTALLEKEHLRRHRLDDEMSQKAFKLYVDRLDPGKMFLLAEDAAALAKYTNLVDDEMHSGTLDLAHDGARRYAARVASVDKMVTEILSKPLDLTNDESLEIDPKKLALCATMDELRDRWRKRLELEVLERVTGMEERLATPKKEPKKDDKDDKDADALDEDGTAPAVPLDQIPPTPQGREAKARADLGRAYAGRFARLRTPGKLGPAADLMNAVTAAFDPHTNYLPPADKANFDIAMSGSLEGIGAVLRERDHYIEVSEVVPGGASWRQGRLTAGDLILSVSNKGQEPVDTMDMPIDEVVKMVRGPKGTVVVLRIRKATGDEETLAITRDVVVIEETYARGAVVTPATSKVSYGYIHLPSFYGGQRSGQRTAASDVKRLLVMMKARKVAGVVIDIRSNGGGFLGDAVKMTGLLIDHGPVVQVEDSAGRREVLDDDDGGTVFDGPVVVMVDRFSASASEIVSGALQDYHRAVIVGTGPTHGKGTVQTLADLDRVGGASDLGVLKITIQQFFRVTGSSTQRQGVVPDITLPDPAGHVEAGERQLENAVPWRQIDPAPHDPWPATWKPDSLAAKSAARVGKEPTFAKIVARVEMLRKRRDDTKVPLARPAWEARRKLLKAEIDATNPEIDKSPARMTVELLDGDTPKPVPPGPGGRSDNRLNRWRDNLARDPWVDESLHVLYDMAH